ncbi:hypothetical protein KXX40_003280 [Aspergillus fumigatus]|nr:hypothetical protein KXX40_003280 [Aspergillus fumigatus]
MDDARLEAALGHKQELKRHFDLVSLVSLGIVIANAWALTGGTIVAALQDGGPMAILYGLILVSVFYTLISASLSELASSMPSAGGVYYWASVSNQEYGRFVGFLTGYLNACAWLLSAASISSMLGNEVVVMYMLLNPGSQWHSWQSFPTAEIYRQATGSRQGAVGLVAVLFVTAFPTLVGVYITGGRMWWSLARDKATPFASYFSNVHPTQKNPVRATVAMAGMALLSSYVVLSTLSYLGAILPHVLTGRKTIVPGPFYMGRKTGLVVNGLAVVYILVTIVLFCFPITLPVTVHNMNYSSVIAVGLVTLTALWWVVRGRHDYRGPQYSVEIAQDLPAVLETENKGLSEQKAA